MRNPIQISNKEKESIRNSHSSFYNGYATGNIPSNLQPLRVDNSVKDHNGITVDNKGNVKQYTNHRVNEEQANDMDVSDVESADNFESEGPEQFNSDYSEESYGMDIDSIMKMFGDDMSSDDVDDEECTMNDDLDGKEMYDNEESAYEFDSQGGDVAVYGEGEGNDEVDESIDREFHTTGGASAHPNPSDLSILEIEDYIKDNPTTLWGRSLSMWKMVLDNKKSEMYDEDGLDESVKKDKKFINEMFTRLKKYS